MPAKLEKLCENCGRKYQVQCNARMARSRFCSRSCLMSLMRRTGLITRPFTGHHSEEGKRRISSSCSGPKHWNWRGGQHRNALGRRLRCSYEDRLWREAVFARDGYACQECGRKGRLQAHHVRDYADYPHLRFDVDNGVTLCVECHKATDTFGIKWYHKKRKEMQDSCPV